MLLFSNADGMICTVVLVTDSQKENENGILDE